MARISGSAPHSPEIRSLSEFGISTFVDDDGALQFTVQVGSGQGSDGHRAVFDKTSRQWRLDESIRLQHHNNGIPTSDLEDRPPITRASSNSKWVDTLPENENVDWLLNGIDWSQTELGPLETWPISLQTVVKVVMSDTCPAVVYWGPHFCACYNIKAHEDVIRRFGGGRQIQGRPFQEIWSNVWADLEPVYNKMQTAVESTDSTNVPVFAVGVDGQREETFWSGTTFPIRGENGQIEGVYNRALDTTDETVRERRANTLYSISAPPVDPTISAWQWIFEAFRENSEDFPMAFAYSAEDDGARCILTLQQSIGIPSTGHSLVPEKVEIHEGSAGLQYYYRKVRSGKKSVVLQVAEGNLPPEFLHGFEWQGYGDEPAAMALLPIAVSSRLLGIMVFCLNPRRRFRPEDDAFINSLCNQASATVAIAVDREESQKRAERMTKELAESERQIRDIAEYGPVGMVRLTPAGSIIWANSQYFEITGHDADDYYDLSFMNTVHPDDQVAASAQWSILTVEQKHVSAEFRMNRKWRPPRTAGNPNPAEEHCWVIVNAFPVLDGTELKSLIASVTDISRTKWAEEIQSRLANEATQARKLQEAFIDIVSHEMRNPLSAITQLADSVAASFENLQTDAVTLDATLRQLGENVESGRTILICAAHQKRIIDDVLTLSKLDSQLLSITPVVMQTSTVVDTVLKMFQAEFDTHEISVENTVDESYQRLDVDWVALDPARLTQIFINLLTNAIKFIKYSKFRRISIRRSVSTAQPPQTDGIAWFPTKTAKRDITLDPEWGSGEHLYLMFSVADTGKGLRPEEMQRLFNRFQQATKKTHIQYGGSGLGLFIARELTENMGGEIGVASTAGKGSTFAFWVKARRASQPQEHDMVLQAPLSPVGSRRTSLHILDYAKRQHALQDGVPTTTRPSVLLVEDNLINAQVLTRQLERAGCLVSVANHGQEALEFLQNTLVWTNKNDSPTRIDVDCILMDVEMPVLDGLACTRQIRDMERNGDLKRHISIIAITANAREEQIESAFDAGVDGVLPKPFRVVELLTKMKEVALKERVQLSEST